MWVSGWAGHLDGTRAADHLDTSTSPPTMRGSGEGRLSLLYFFENRTVELQESSTVQEDNTGIPPAQPIAQAPGAATPPVHAATTFASFVPSAEQGAGVAAAAATVGLLYYLWPLAKGALGLFSRLKQPEVLSHPSRQQLLQLIESQPGIHFKEMARRTGLPNGSLVHHLETLRRSGQVVARPSGGYTLYFLGAHVPAGSAEAASALKADGARKILDVVRSQPGLSSADVAARTGLQPSTVTYHVQRLQSAGLLMGLRDGRAVRLHPVEAVSVAA
jgi:predicted transcriptional regulator